MKKYFNFIIFSLLISCAGVNQTRNIQPPSVYSSDVPIVPYEVDAAAYNISLPPLEDVAINLQIRDGSGPNGELVAPLRRGQPAPFNGALLNGAAVARIEVEFRGQAARCQIDRQADIDRVSARAIRDINILLNTLGTQRQIYELMITSRDQEISRLYSIARDLNRSNGSSLNVMQTVLWTASGFLVGAAIATITTFVLIH